MVQHNVEYIYLTLNTTEREKLAETEYDEDNVTDRGDCVQIPFVDDEQKGRTSLNNPRIASLEELKFSFVTYLKDKKPHLLECQVENTMHDRGHKIHWTPPYCTELQPIEMFW